MINNGNESASPVVLSSRSEDNDGNIKITSNDQYMAGLTKREHFAAIAMQGLLSGGSCIHNGVVVAKAVELADAMLIELEKTQNEEVK